jgi:hypothetical protein
MDVRHTQYDNCKSERSMTGLLIDKFRVILILYVYFVTIDKRLLLSFFTHPRASRTAEPPPPLPPRARAPPPPPARARARACVRGGGRAGAAAAARGGAASCDATAGSAAMARLLPLCWALPCVAH